MMKREPTSQLGLMFVMLPATSVGHLQGHMMLRRWLLMSRRLLSKFRVSGGALLECLPFNFVGQL